MVRNMMLATVFGVLLSATAVYAQDAGEEKAIRFEPSVQILGLENGGLTVLKPGAEAPVNAIPYKAYPYGSKFVLADGVKCRLRFSDLSYAIVKGPAKFMPTATDAYQKVALDVEKGDVNFSIDDRALQGQFTVITPMGSFTSLKGGSRLRVGEISEEGEIDDDDFSFRVMSGSAVFSGLHYAMNDMSQANAFRSADSVVTTATGKEFRDTRIVGVSGEVKTALPMGGEAMSDLSVNPGTIVKITRARQPGSNNWVVSVLTLYANGLAQNYFCYVEGRSQEYATGELVGELLPEEDEEGDGEEGEDGEDVDADASGEGMDDFGDDELL